MAITDTINEARNRGASDDQIVKQLIANNPAKKAVLEQAIGRGASSSIILEKIITDNPEKRPAIGEKGTIIGGIGGSVISDILGVKGQEKDEGISGLIKGIFRSTVGSEGLMALPQKLAGAVVAVPAAKAALKTAESRSQNVSLANEIIKRAQSETDKVKRDTLFKQAKDLLSSGLETSKEAQSMVKKVQPYVPSLKEISGATLQTTAAVLPASKAVPIAKGAIAGAIKETVKRSAITGATSGALFGTGSALQQDKKAADVILSGLGGAVAGAAGGALVGVASLTPYFVKNIPTIAKAKLEDASSKFLNLTPKQIKIEGKSVKNTPRFIVEEGVFPMLKRGENGTLDTSDAVQSLIGKYDIEENAFDSVLKDSGKYFDLNKLEKKVLKEIDTTENRAKGIEYKKMVDTIKSQIASIKENLGDNIIESDGQSLLPAELFNQVKRGAWSATKGFGSVDDRALSDTNYKIGHTAKEMIEDGIDDANIRSLNSRLGDFSSAIKILNDRNGTRLPGGKIGRYFTRVVGSIAGSGGGPLGSIAGAITADKIADTLADPRITTALYQKMVKNYGRNIVAEAEEILKNRAAQRASTLRLPAIGGTTSKIITPSPTTFEPQVKRSVKTIRPVKR